LQINHLATLGLTVADGNQELTQQGIHFVNWILLPAKAKFLILGNDSFLIIPGTDVMILKIFSQINSAKKLAFFAQNKAKLCKNWITTLFFEKNAIFSLFC
jgi:hypothetical protein